MGHGYGMLFAATAFAPKDEGMPDAQSPSDAVQAMAKRPVIFVKRSFLEEAEPSFADALAAAQHFLPADAIMGERYDLLLAESVMESTTIERWSSKSLPDALAGFAVGYQSPLHYTRNLAVAVKSGVIGASAFWLAVGTTPE